MHTVNTQHHTKRLMWLKKSVIHKIHKITQLTVLRTYKLLGPTIASRSHETEPFIEESIHMQPAGTAKLMTGALT